MALRDHFHDKWHDDHKQIQLEDDPATYTLTTVPRKDQWALNYLNIVRLQPVSEAFDDDASGFITIAEANTFTRLRPLGWRYGCYVVQTA
jgi:hypothetical protein